MELTAGKVAVVTGAASGIGLALAERFARAGLDVVLADVEETALQAAAQQIASLGRQDARRAHRCQRRSSSERASQLPQLTGSERCTWCAITRE